jgi:chemotaxis protein methyltransferase CheR
MIGEQEGPLAREGVDTGFVRDMVLQRCGVRLAGAAHSMIQVRLASLARREGLPSVSDLIAVMRTRRDERLLASVCELLLTRETSFFHDRRMFERLETVILPELARARAGRLMRVWSAACATGQEAYSLALLLERNPGCVGAAPVEIVASDVSEHCIEAGRAALFSQYDVQRGLSVRQLIDCFSKEDERWRLRQDLRDRVTFRRHNLLEPAAWIGQVDLLLCCNLLGAMDPGSAERVLSNLAARLAPDGWLVVARGEERLAAGAAFEPTPGCPWALRPRADRPFLIAE